MEFGDDLYGRLNVPSDASYSEIRTSFRNLSKLHHPDKTGKETKQYTEISEAYIILSDETKRQIYDKSSMEGIRRYGQRVPRSAPVPRDRILSPLSFIFGICIIVFLLTYTTYIDQGPVNESLIYNKTVGPEFREPVQTLEPTMRFQASDYYHLQKQLSTQQSILNHVHKEIQQVSNKQILAEQVLSKIVSRLSNLEQNMEQIRYYLAKNNEDQSWYQRWYQGWNNWYQG